MNRPDQLKHKPLVEAILEAKWALEPGPVPEAKRDPHYKFLLGTLFEKIRDAYPHHEELPAASIPDEITPHVVHHRFRTEPGGWPLLQVGPGIFTVNETAAYDWNSFRHRIDRAITTLFTAYPKPEALKVETLMLRFINAIPLDFAKVNMLEFLKAKMRTSLSLPHSIFEDSTISPNPVELVSQFVFPCEKPSGVLFLKFSSGRKGPDPALIFDLRFISRGRSIPRMPEDFLGWADAAHAVIENTFFRLIEGDLEKEFRGDD